MDISEINNKYVSLFRDNYKLLKNGSKYIDDIRTDAIEKFKVLGIPDRKNENYLYTDLKPLFERKYDQQFEPHEIDIDINEVFKCDVPELDTHLVLLVNGWYYDNNAPLSDLPEGVVIGSFAKLSGKYPDLIRKYYSKYSDHDKDGIVALNTALAKDGLFIYVPEGVILEKPVQVINMLLSDQDMMANQRNFIFLEKDSQAKIIICDHTLSTPRFLTNSVTEVVVSENAVFDYYNVQNEHNMSTQINSTFIYQKANSNVLSNTISLHGGIIRNNIKVIMDDERCENNMYGIFFSDKDQHVDNFTHIDHKKPNCISKELFKGILDDNSTGAFAGRIIVREGAQRTNAFQANNNILLTDQARMNTKPQLEIYADDVKCSHGATVGQLDEDAMFYLRSRGIGEREARLMLMTAFAGEVIGTIRIKPLQDRIYELVEKRLRGEFSKCNNCVFQCKQ